MWDILLLEPDSRRIDERMESDMQKQYPLIDKIRTGKRIRYLMGVLGLTVVDVQGYMGLATKQAVYHWMNGRSLPTLDNIYALSELFKVPMDSIVCGNRVYQSNLGSMYERMKLYVDYLLLKTSWIMEK